MNKLGLLLDPSFAIGLYLTAGAVSFSYFSSPNDFLRDVSAVKTGFYCFLSVGLAYSGRFTD